MSRRSAFFLFVLFFLAFYVLHGKRISTDPHSPLRFHLLTGDEPHYLLITHSIAFDHDINLTNNIAQQDYRFFYDKPVSGYTKDRQFWLNYVKGRLKRAPDRYWETRGISVCPVGMPLLIAPAYYLGHLLGGRIRYTVALLFHAIAAACAVMITDMLLAITAKRTVALAVTVSFVFAGPLLFYTVPVFPELLAAFVILQIVQLTMRAIERHGITRYISFMATGLLIGYLPWLHDRFLLYSVILLAYTLLRTTGLDRKSRKLSVASIGLPLIVMATCLAHYYWKKYGVPWPVSTHPPFSLIGAATSGGPGLWLDRDNGLLFYCPIAVAFFPGSVLAWRRGPTEARLAVLLVLANWLLIGLFSDWRGGLCPPMRYWVSAMPMLAVPCGLYVSQLHSRLSKVLFALLGICGIGIGLEAMRSATSLYRYSHPIFYRWPSLRYHRMPNVYFPSSDLPAILLVIAALLSLMLFLRLQRYDQAPDSGPGPQ